MGNGKLLQVLTLLLCLSFGYFTFKNYEDIKELRDENAFLRDTIDSLLCQPATASIKEGIGKPEEKSERNVAADKSEKKSSAKPAASMTSSSKSAASKPAEKSLLQLNRKRSLLLPNRMRNRHLQE